jgi:hypothetical protein
VPRIAARGAGEYLHHTTDDLVVPLRGSSGRMYRRGCTLLRVGPASCSMGTSILNPNALHA